MEPAAPEITYRVEGPLATITLDRPQQLNALTLTLIDELRRLVLAAEADPAVVAIAITGAGKGFCSGMDVSVLEQAAGRDASLAQTKQPEALFGFLREVSKPVIAAVNGVAAGGGFILAMMADLRFAAAGARFSTVFSRRGLIAEHASSWMLPRQVGIANALDLLWSSRMVSADEALRMGFVNRVVPDEALLDSVAAYVLQLAQTVSRRSIAVMKREVYGQLEKSFVQAQRECHFLMFEALAAPDAKEGVRSFLERRPPAFQRWTGEQP